MPQTKTEGTTKLSVRKSIDILALNETFLKLKIKFHFPGYDIYKKQQISRHQRWRSDPGENRYHPKPRMEKRTFQRHN